MWCSLRGYRGIASVVQQVRRKTTSNSAFGIVFDIDGVLMQGKNKAPTTTNALNKLMGHKGWVSMFLTNGGGKMEELKASELQTSLEVPISSDGVVVSHTVYKKLVDLYKNVPVVVVGHGPVDDVARHYGFDKVAHVDQIAYHYASVCPNPMTHALLPIPKQHSPPFPLLGEGSESVGAILVFSDPLRWEVPLQVILDLCVNGGNLTSKHSNSGKQLPLYFCNPDFTYKGCHVEPRLAGGSFRVCLEALYKRATGKSLAYTTYGKPTPFTYDYAKDVLSRKAIRQGFGGVDRVYAIGDNPAADVDGANQAGWTSILVCSGVYSGPPGPTMQHVHNAQHCVNHVGDAIDLIMELEKSRCGPWSAENKRNCIL